jgi:hypothetical protein
MFDVASRKNVQTAQLARYRGVRDEAQSIRVPSVAVETSVGGDRRPTTAQALSPLPHRLFPERLAAWRSAGLSARAAAALATSGCDTIPQVVRLGRAYFEGRANIGPKTLAELAKLAGWPPKRRTALDVVSSALSIGLDPEEAREAACDVMAALRRSGFVLVTARREVRA